MPSQGAPQARPWDTRQINELREVFAMKITSYGDTELVDFRKHSIYRFTDNIWKIVQFYDDRERHGPGPRENHKTYDEKLPSSISRTKRVVLELALCNPWDYFVSLTIAPDHDRDHLKATFPVILQWLRDQRKKGQQLDYLLIPERHKKGTWHFHGFLRGVRESDLESFRSIRKRGNVLPPKLVKGDYLNWTPYSQKFGFCSLNRVKNPVSCAFYCTKYITKDNTMLVDEVGMHKYSASRPLLRPDKYAEFYTRSPEIDRLLTSKNEYCATGFVLPKHDVSWADFVALDDSPIDFSSMNPLDAYDDARAEAERFYEYEQMALNYWSRNNYGGYI